jgi:hypothetical protein
MQIADHAFGAVYLFAIELEDDAQPPGGGMLRPQLRTSSVESRKVVSAMAGYCPLMPKFSSPSDRPVSGWNNPAQRKAFPFFGQDAPHVGMAFELGAEHVKNFAF